jgi:site-specific recombinase XerD
MQENRLDKFEKELQARRYKPRTIKTYSTQLRRLIEFFPDKDVFELDFESIKEFYYHTKDKQKASTSIMKQVYGTLTALYETILKKNYPFKELHKAKGERKIYEIFTTAEIRSFIPSIKNLKHKLMFSLMYGCGLDLNEIQTILVTDFDLKRKILKIKNSNGISRTTIIPNYCVSLYDSYLKEFSPQKYLFEGQKPKSQLYQRSIQHALNKAVQEAGFNKKITTKTLKYSYIVHLEKLGVPLNTILEHLDLKSGFTFKTFSEYCFTGTKDKVEFSPIDKILESESTEDFVNTDSLEILIDFLENEDEKDFLLESVACLKSNALRAGVIFAWTAAVSNLRKKCLRHSKKLLNDSLLKHQPNLKKDIKTEDDFSYVKDSTMLKALLDLGEIEKSEKDILEECLNLRNKCGHPSKYKPKPLKAAAFIEDLITTVFRKK